MREIIIDEDTRIYYIYKDKSYYIENKDTTTPRTEVEEAKKVLDIVAPNNDVTIDDLTLLATEYEHLTSLSYTWEDTGAYIKTIQLNSFDKYPICIDCEKSKLYIMNTDIIFDLTLTEGRRNRLDIMQLYYRDTLGLELTLQELTALYSLITLRYNPTSYNVIATPTDTTTALKYTNTIKLSNYRKNSPATYTVTQNPKNLYNYEVIGHIVQIENNAILLSDSAPDYLKVGQELNVSNAYTTVDTTTYTADGTYIIQEIDDNLILTTENLSSPYLYQPPTLFAVAYKASVLSVDRDARSIVIPDTADATLFKIGDSIVIHGTVIATEYENLTVDGTYTISGIDNNIIYTEEYPPTNYEAPIGALTLPYVYKPIEACTIYSIDSTHIYIETALPNYIEVGNEVMVSYANGVEQPTLEYTTVSGIDNKTLTISTPITEFTPNFGLLRKPIPYPETLITIDSSTNTDLLPTGSFMVDNTEQVNQYLNLLPNLTLTNSENYTSLNQYLPQTYPVSIGNITEMSLLGLYSEIYEENN